MEARRIEVRLIAFALLIGAAQLPFSQAAAQVLPVCLSAQSDSDGDGYGWENEASCIVAAGQCEDRGDYPWGWNPVTLESCRLDADSPDADAGTCVDTDPVGDGWGWDGVSSCRIAVQPDLTRCDDAGVYPWGWNPTLGQSCRLDLVVTPELPFTAIGDATVPAVPFADYMDVDLVCRRLVSRYYCNCDNSITDTLMDADEYSDLFFSFRLEDHGQSDVIRETTYATLLVAGTWGDLWSNEPTAYIDNGNQTSLRYAPSPGQSYSFFGSMALHVNASGDLFLRQFDGLGGGNDLTTVSHCVIR